MTQYDTTKIQARHAHFMLNRHEISLFHYSFNMEGHFSCLGLFRGDLRSDIPSRSQFFQHFEEFEGILYKHSEAKKINDRYGLTCMNIVVFISK